MRSQRKAHSQRQKWKKGKNVFSAFGSGVGLKTIYSIKNRDKDGLRRVTQTVNTFIGVWQKEGSKMELTACESMENGLMMP